MGKTCRANQEKDYEDTYSVSIPSNPKDRQEFENDLVNSAVKAVEEATKALNYIIPQIEKIKWTSLRLKVEFCKAYDEYTRLEKIIETSETQMKQLKLEKVKSKKKSES